MILMGGEIGGALGELKFEEENIVLKENKLQKSIRVN